MIHIDSNIFSDTNVIVIFLVIVLVMPNVVFAAQVNGMNGFFGSVLGFADGFWEFVTVTIPNIVSDFFIWATAYYLYLKFTWMLGAVEFAHSGAKTFLELIDISSVVNVAISALPSDFKQIAVDTRFFDGLTLVVEAWITRLVYSGF